MGTDKGFNYQCSTGEVHIPPPPRLGSAMKHLDDIFHIDLPLPPLQLTPHLPAPSIEFPVGLRAVSISLYPSTEVVRPLPPLFSRADNSNQGWGWWCRWRGWRWGWRACRWGWGCCRRRWGCGVVEGVMGVEAGWRRGKWSNQYTRWGSLPSLLSMSLTRGGSHCLGHFFTSLRHTHKHEHSCTLLETHKHTHTRHFLIQSVTVRMTQPPWLEYWIQSARTYTRAHTHAHRQCEDAGMHVK